MKTFALLFLSLFLTKSCHQKNATTENAPVSETVKTDSSLTEQAMQTTTPEMKEIKVETGTKVEYQALSRGYFCRITYQNNQITVALDRNNLEKATVVMLTKADISEISNLVEAVNLNELPNLKAPSKNRMHDGAPHAKLTITANGKIYNGAGFDGGNPPAAIKKLVTKLDSYSNQK